MTAPKKPSTEDVPEVIKGWSPSSWEIERVTEPSMRWWCDVCHLLSAEHPNPWWGCRGLWQARP